MGKVEIDYVRIWQPISSAACAATFVGTGGNDAPALQSFLNSHAHQNVCLQGTINLSSAVNVTIPAGPLTTWNWQPGTKLKINTVGEAGIRMINCFDLTLNSPEVQGTSFNWVGGEDPAQTESGLEIYGGNRIIINDPYCHDTRGDGIYSGVGFGVPDGGGTLGLTINRPNMLRNARNGITPNVGVMTINGPGTIDQSGLHSIDMEPNTDLDATTIKFIMNGIRMTNFAQFSGTSGFTGMAVAGCGHTGGRRQLVDIRNSSADAFKIALANITTVNLDVSSDSVVNGNSGGLAFYTNIGSLNLIRTTNLTLVNYVYC